MADDADDGTSRRTLLKVGWAGAALLAVGGGMLGTRGGVLREPRAKLHRLSVHEFSIVAAMADRFHPGVGGLPTAWELRVPEKLDGLLWSMHPADSHELQNGLRFFENALTGAILDRRFNTFTASTPSEQDAIIETWRGSSMFTRRMLIKATRGLTASIYWADPRVFSHCGYPGPPNFGNVVQP